MDLDSERDRGPISVSVLGAHPQGTLSVLFSSFVNQELVLKQLAELKEGHLRTSERPSYPLVTHSALG